MSYKDRPDFDWNKEEAEGVGSWMILTEFRKSPLIRLFDETAIDRLSWYVMEQLVQRWEKNGGSLNYSQAASSTQEIVEESPYGVFGHQLASTIAACVQKALYNQSIRS